MKTKLLIPLLLIVVFIFTRITVNANTAYPLSDDLVQHIEETCYDYAICFELVMAIIEYESNYETRAIGDGGEAYGLMQIQPKWHQERMQRLNVSDLLNPYENIVVGIDYLYECFVDTGDIFYALMTYNMGYSRATTLYRQGIYSQYAQDITARAAELERMSGK